MRDLETIMGLAPIIPVLTVERVEEAVPIAQALVAGGLPVLEVTLRTPVALDVIREMRQVEGAVVGAGTVLDARQLDLALEAGCEFVVSPGLTDALSKAAVSSGAQLLPGVATAGEIMRANELGYPRLKFFPATSSGGLPALRAFAAVFPQVKFCPTGGIAADNAGEWLEQPNVACVGGSWLVSGGAAPEEIEARARHAAALRSSR